jgi:glycosyltransferase involved in cell wall biosynthesis
MGRFHSLPVKVSVLYNGVNSSLFYKLDYSSKFQLKSKLGLDEKIVFLWIASDRPKKGLSIIIDAWKESKLFQNEKYVLKIIGTPYAKSDSNIDILGEIQHSILPIYYQSSDYYLFSTLCHEGFPLSLTEALKCGLTCFVSDISPLREVIQNGKYAYLVSRPNMPCSWKFYFNLIAEESLQLVNIEKENLDRVYDLDDWCNNMEIILNNEKNNILSDYNFIYSN